MKNLIYIFNLFLISLILINCQNSPIDQSIENEIKTFISQNRAEKLVSEGKFEKSEKPKISIIIPVYNNDANLVSTIRSIQNQNLQDIEIFAINDHSNDSSWKILKNLQKDDHRIAGIRNRGML